MKYILLVIVLTGIAMGGYYTFYSLDDDRMQYTNPNQEERIGGLEAIEKIQVSKTRLEGDNNILQRSPEKDEDVTIAVKQKDNMKEVQPIDMPNGENMRTMLVAGGCFWCVESDLEKLSGVITAVSGYADGITDNPTYANYIAGGHREVVEVLFNSAVVSFEDILIYTMKHTDPTDDNGSFGDRGNYYSTAFYYQTDKEKNIIESLITEVNEFGPYEAPLAIDVLERPTFWKAEDYHQDYYAGALSKLKYMYYRHASGRDTFMEKYWGDDTSASLTWRNVVVDAPSMPWSNFTKPNDTELKKILTDMQYKVTQKNGTERSFNNTYWDNHVEGIYVDVISGEPLFSSTHKFDSGTGWPSFTRPIEFNYITEHDDYVLLHKRTEVRSLIADSHLGHIFHDAPVELGGIRYCINSASLRFIPKIDMESDGYGLYLYLFN